jgi:hypothetical protein
MESNARGVQQVRNTIYEAFQRHSIPLGSELATGVQNSLAPSAPLAAAVQTSAFARTSVEVREVLVAPTEVLASDWKSGLGKEAGWHPMQIKAMESKVSGRTERFGEEVCQGPPIAAMHQSHAPSCRYGNILALITCWKFARCWVSR